VTLKFLQPPGSPPITTTGELVVGIDEDSREVHELHEELVSIIGGVIQDLYQTIITHVSWLVAVQPWILVELLEQFVS